MTSRVLLPCESPVSITKSLADALYREEVARARSMYPADKLLEGPRLFERARRVMIDGIRHQHPELDETSVVAMLLDRLNRIRALDRR